MKRREFIKKSGAAMAAGSLLLTACKEGKNTQTAAEGSEPSGTMTMRHNPNTGDEVSLLGFGMMRLPVEDGGTDQNHPDSDIDQEMVNRLVDHALEHGVNYFDTSPVYCRGFSESSTGIALSRHPRSSYYIATKLSNFSPETWSAEESKAIFERSLEYLRTDYIDYYLLHSIGGGSDSLATFNGRFMDNGMLDWCVEQKRLGRIRNLGFSYHGDIKIFDMLLRWHDEGRYHWDFVQIELNYLDWDYADEINHRNTDARYLYAELESRGIPAVIMEPLLGGRLARLPETITKTLRERDPEASVASWAFRFAGTPTGVLTVLSGMTYMEHLADNLRTYCPLRPLTTEEEHFLLSVANDIYGMKAVPCTTCNYCMPCPYGINIPGIFSHYNRCLAEDRMPQYGTADQQAYSRHRRAFLVGYDRAVSPLRQADHCIGCGHCVNHCPQRIDIPAELERIDRFVEQLKQG